MRVLIFDDDAAVGRLVVRIATMSGMDAIAVTDAEGFARHLIANPPDLILLDLQLGGTDGVEQLRYLSERQYAGSVVLMSGFDARVLGTAGALGQSLGLKVEGVLEKPLRAAELEKVFERQQSADQSPTIERLLAAIVNDELSLDFQPIVTRDPIGLTPPGFTPPGLTPLGLKKLEALVRWDHPVLGRIPPAEFLPMAERDSAAIDALTEWVLGAAVEAYQVLAEVGIAVPLAVNISAQNLHDLTFPDRLDQRLRDGGMPARHLCLEITETAAFKDPALTMDILTRIRLKGMQLAIDDFGTGYSSLKMLRQMPFTEIKIDFSFVRDITTSRDSRIIAKSIMDLAANMEMDCVAEGIETRETAELLEQLGRCAMQGTFIARPMPVEAVPAWLASWQQRDLAAAPAHASGGVPGQDLDQAPGGVMDGPLGHAAGHANALAPAPGQETMFPPRPGPAADAASAVARLSPRQLEVMQLLSQGKSVKEIARHLELGVGTVKVHLSQAYSTLGARNRVEAVMRAGLLS